MILLWAALLFLHQVYSLVPVITVQLGEPVTFTCALPNAEISHRKINWYKQSVGNNLKLITTLLKTSQHTPVISEPRLLVNADKNFFNLTIVRTIQEDAGMYHCESTEWAGNSVWSGTYLFLKDPLCEKSSDSLRSSDAGTYYCAVATCGEILFGNGTKLQIDQKATSEFVALVVAVVCLAISVTGNIIFICCVTQRQACAQFKGIESSSSQERQDKSSQAVHDITEDEYELNYAALHFSGRKVKKERKKEEWTEESVYSQVKG